MNAADTSRLTREERHAAWCDVIRKVNMRLVDLRQERHHFREMAALAERLPELKGYFLMDVRRWFAAFAAMAIRREMDTSADCESLKKLLDEISRYGLDAVDYDGRPLDLAALRDHRRRLAALSATIVHIADKEVAHATVAGADERLRPTFEELFACIDAFESIAVGYRAVLTGESLITLDDGNSVPVRFARP